MSTAEQRKKYYEKNKERICNYYKMRYLEKKLQIERENKKNEKEKTEKNEDIKFSIKKGSFIISFD